MTDVADGTRMLASQLTHVQMSDGDLARLLILSSGGLPQLDLTMDMMGMTDAVAGSWFIVPMTSASDLSGLSWRPISKSTA